MQSKTDNVKDYLKTVPLDRKTTIERLRSLCLDNLIGFEETMEYGMPSYRRNGVVEVAFNSQKNFITLYILRKDVLDRHRDKLTDLSLGKGCIRYSKPEKMKIDIVEKLLVDTFKSRGIICD